MSFPANATLSGVGGSSVTEDLLNVQFRTSFAEDNDDASQDNRLRNRVVVDYGVTDDFALRIYGETDRRHGDNIEFGAVALEGRFELTEAKDHGFYSGLRLRYTYHDGDKKADNANFRVILGKPVGNWDFRLNQFFAFEVGQERENGLGLETRLQASYGVKPALRVGIESFSSFGYGEENTGFDEQSHTAGPVVLGRITDSLGYEAGYQYGLSDAAPDHAFKLFITKNF